MSTGGRCDVLVVGGGPVGLAAAVEARLAGLTATVLEPREGPVDKACGEGLMPGAVTALERLGVRPAGRPFAGIAYVAPGRYVRADFGTGPGLGVRRVELSRALADRAEELGVRRVRGRAEEVAVGADGVRAGGVEAAWLLAADGLHSPTRRLLGLDAPGRGPERYGLRRHFALAPWSDVVEVHWAETAEAYVTPVGDDCVGVAVLGGRGGTFEQRLAGFPALLDRLAGAEPLSATLGAGPLRQSATRRVQGRVLLVGDASGYVDALTGEGLALGMAGARAAVVAIASGRPQDYEHAWRRVGRRHRVATEALLAAATRPWSRRLVVPAAQRLPRVFAGVVDLLASDAGHASADGRRWSLAG
ncbi:NAD(P)/FAD-dependent oxidoreductase [Phycicoccus avicenniae]|uniref:NAD(P)/FAD-dependent oxidoreductase n=1 Tax=Phycicoccus avicenniae TaxID=2828860 RepID=UPI003D29780E